VDEELRPSEMVFCELERKIPETSRWRDQLQCKQKWIYDSLLNADELLDLEPFDLVLFLGVIYHNVEPVRMLNILNRVTRLGGHMLLESTIDPRPDAVIRVQYGQFTKSFASVAALRVMLAWTGWRKVTQFRSYRPGSYEALFLCEKTHEIGPDFPQPHRSLEWEE
jgi:SAM-dependent methyltransferase